MSLCQQPRGGGEIKGERQRDSLQKQAARMVFLKTAGTDGIPFLLFGIGKDIESKIGIANSLIICQTEGSMVGIF